MATIQRNAGVSPAPGMLGTQSVIRALAWPVLTLLITGGLHFTAEAIWPDLQTIFVPAVLAPLLLVYGLWVGYRAITAGGTFITAVVAGAIVGLLPLTLDVVGFGVILNRGVEAGGLAGIFGFGFVFFGSLVGSGFVLSGEAAGRS